MLYAYTYKRNLDGTFDVPFVLKLEPDEAKREANYTVISDVEAAVKNQLHIKTLVYLGKFDQKEGKFFDLACEDLIDLSVPYHQIISLRGDGHGGN